MEFLDGLPLATTLKATIMVRQLFYLTLILISTISKVNGQTMDKDVEIAEIDSLQFKSMQEQLIGCWKTKYYQFKYYKEKNLGSEYKSRVHSSAPIFKLILKDNNVYIEWIELTGGGSLQKIIKIKKNRLTVENEDGKKVLYKRNKDC